MEGVCSPSWQVLKRARAIGGELLTCASGDTWVTAVSDTVVDQPSSLSPYSTYTWFFPTPFLGAFLQTLREYRVLQDQKELPALLSGLLS